MQALLEADCEIDHVNRYLLWVGVPVGYFLLSCCACCFLCCCCAGPSSKSAAERALRDMDIADLAAVMNEAEMTRTARRELASGLEDEEDDEEVAPSKRYAKTRRPKASSREVRMRAAEDDDDEIVPA